jgi:Sushi repeat (SCR repeat)
MKIVSARCKLLPKPPRNGMVIAPKTDHNMKARYKCKDGFSLKGNSLSVCNYGNWTGDAPTCAESIHTQNNPFISAKFTNPI